MSLSFHVSSPQIVDAEPLFPRKNLSSRDQPLARAFLIKAEKNNDEMFALDGVDPNDGWVLNEAGMGEFLIPTFQPETWFGLSFHSTRLTKCIDATARTSVGLGAGAYVPKGSEGNRNIHKAAQRDREDLQELLDAPNPDIPIEEVLFRAEKDRQSCGYCSVEVLEEGGKAGGKIFGLNHVRAVGVRIHKSKDMYVRLAKGGSSTSKVYFRRFGDTDEKHAYLDSEKGLFYENWPADRPVDLKATALMLVDNYSPLDANYGQPTAVSALTAIVSNHMISMWNINFLNNNASVPLAVIVEGGQLSTDSREFIEAYLKREGKGIRNTGRALILEPDAKSGLGGANVKIRLETLQLGVQEDASFLKLRSVNDEEIREAFGLAAIFLGKDNSAQSRAAGAVREVTQEQVISPITKMWEFKLNANIARNIGGGGAKVRIKRPINMDSNQMAGVVYRLRDALSVNDLREFSSALLQLPDDLPTMDGEFSDMPLAVLKLLAKEMYLTQNPPPESSSAPENV